MVLFSLQTVEFITSTVTLLFAYIFSVTLVGWLEAYVAVRAGDTMPEELGFLSMNPLIYIDFVGLFCTLILGFGWGRILPFNPHHVDGPRKFLRVFFVYMAKPLFALLLALFALIVNVFLVGPHSLQFGFWTIFSKNIPLQQLTKFYPHTASFTLILVIFLLSIIAINTFIATWNIINNIFHYILFLGAEQDHDYMKHAELLAFFGPLFVLIFFTGPLRFFLMKIITFLAYVFASWCGVCP